MKIEHPRDPIYMKACAREAQFWIWADDYAEIKIPARVTKYENLKRFGDARGDEITYLKSLGTFAHGVSLGSGGGSYELGLLKEWIVEHFVFIDISEGALATLKSNAEKLGLSDKIETRIQDFNFLELPEDTYDFVSCQNMLHHIVNLEESLYAINRALTDDGIFVTNECIGENKMYYTDAKMDFFREIQDQLREKGIAVKEYQRTNPHVLTNNCPFECVRSTDLYGIISYYFWENAIRHAAYGHLQHAWHGLTDDTSDTYFDLLEKFDEFVADNELVQANRLYWIYKKSDRPLLPSTPRTQQEKKANIGVSAISERSLMNRWEKLRKYLPGVYNMIKRLYFKVR